MPRRTIDLILCLVMLSGIHMTIAQNIAAQELLNSQDQNKIHQLQRQLKALKVALDQTNAELIALQNNMAAVLANAALALGPFVSVEPNSIEGVPGTNIIITGANVHIRSGSGVTDDNGSPTGLGNLIIGYNEPPAQHVLGPSDRGGSHNLIVGIGHVFGQVGGFVAGTENALLGPFAVISGGIGNSALGYSASISGGINNKATDSGSSVSGGINNIASASGASVSGGIENEAKASGASVSGGINNIASGEGAITSGGIENVASGRGAGVSGGLLNTASGTASSVSGGLQRSTDGKHDWAAGSLYEDD